MQRLHYRSIFISDIHCGRIEDPQGVRYINGGDWSSIAPRSWSMATVGSSCRIGLESGKSGGLARAAAGAGGTAVAGSCLNAALE
jgi:hypothetical protein